MKEEQFPSKHPHLLTGCLVSLLPPRIFCDFLCAPSSSAPPWFLLLLRKTYSEFISFSYSSLLFKSLPLSWKPLKTSPHEMQWPLFKPCDLSGSLETCPLPQPLWPGFSGCPPPTLSSLSRVRGGMERHRFKWAAVKSRHHSWTDRGICVILGFLLF